MIKKTVFLWHKFLHLFERHPCEISSFPPQHTIKFSTLLLKTIQEIVNEILKVGHGLSNKKLRDPLKENKDHFLSIKAIEGIWAKAIQPRRPEKTQCIECLKKNAKENPEKIELFSQKKTTETSIKACNSDNDKKEEFPEKQEIKFEKSALLQKSSEFSYSSEKPPHFPKNSEFYSSLNSKEEILSKKETFERDLQKKSLMRQKSLKLSGKMPKDAYFKSKIQENNKYMFSKHKVAKGDDILAIFAKWLFDCGSSNFPGFEELNLLSIQILSKIFRKARGPFKEEFLLKFYCLLLENMKKEENSGYLKICVKLFEVNLPNTYYIIKEFMLQFAQSSNKSQPTKFLDIYSKYISRFACSYMGRLKYIEEFERKFDHYYYSLDYWINHVVECMKLWEKKEKNLCLKTVNWVFAIHNTNQRKFHSIVEKIFNSCNSINNSKNGKVSTLKMMGLCFSIMLSVGEIYHLRKLKNEDGLGKEEMTDIKKCLEVFVKELDVFLKKFDIKVQFSFVFSLFFLEFFFVFF